MRTTELDHVPSLAVTGVATRAALRADALSDRMLTRACTGGRLARLRRGWYRDAAARPDVVSAVRAGGVLTGARRLKLLAERVWLPEHADLDVLVPSGMSLHPKPGVRGHTRPHLRHQHCPHGVAPVRVALGHAVQGESWLDAVAIVDTLINAVRRGELPWHDNVGEATIMLELQRSFVGRRITAICDGAADSGPESMARMHCLGQSWKVETQYRLEEGLTLDLLVEGCVGVEIDGGTHVEMTQYRRDRRKDALAALRHIRVMRFTYDQVMHPELMIAAIATALAERR